MAKENEAGRDDPALKRPESATFYHRESDPYPYQRKFLEAIEVHANHVLKELAERIFPLYQHPVLGDIGSNTQLFDLFFNPKGRDLSSDISDEKCPPPWWWMMECWAEERRFLIPATGNKTSKKQKIDSPRLMNRVDLDGRQMTRWELFNWYAGNRIVPLDHPVPGDNRFPELSEPDEIFGFPFLGVVNSTLHSWRESGLPTPLRWVFPQWFVRPKENLDNLLSLANMAKLNKGLRWITMSQFTNLIAQSAPSFQIPTWNIAIESRSDFAERTIASFRKLLNKHLDDVEEWAALVNFVPLKQEHAEYDYEWLVFHQIDGLTPDEITRRHLIKYLDWKEKDIAIISSDYRTTHSAIVQARHKVALRVVGPEAKSWLRPVRRGKPPHKSAD